MVSGYCICLDKMLREGKIGINNRKMKKYYMILYLLGYGDWKGRDCGMICKIFSFDNEVDYSVIYRGWYILEGVFILDMLILRRVWNN